MEHLQVGDIEITPTIKRLCDGFTWVINQINEKTNRKLTYGECEKALQITRDQCIMDSVKEK